MTQQVTTKPIPDQIQKLVWSKTNGLDIETDKVAIIHHVLRYGTLEDIAWLMQTYEREEIKEVFLTKPVNIYSKPSFNFAKNTLLKIKQPVVDETKYIQSFY
jgi:hypothetical protein